MKVKIREEDRRAMDLLLDRVAVATGKAQGSSVYAIADGQIRDRIARVEKVLSVLDALPATEPPRDLVAKTLKLIAATSNRNFVAPTHSRAQAFNGNQHPHA